MNYPVVFAQDALQDLRDIYDYLASQADFDIADGILERIIDAARGLASFPNRGSSRDDVQPGLRSISYQRRTTIFYLVEDDQVVIIHVLYGGRDIATVFGIGPT